MNSLAATAPAFVAMAHRIVWCNVATVDAKGRPRSRVLDPIWQWEDLLRNGPAPVGYDPAMIPGWTGPTAATFAALKLEPWRLRVFPGTVLLGKGGDVLTWQRTA